MNGVIKCGSFLIGLLSVLLVIFEKQMPLQNSLKFEELPEAVQAWERKGI